MSACCQALLLACGRFFFRVRNALFPTLLLVILVATRPTQFFGSAALDAVAIAAGVVLLLGGEAFRMLVIGYAYIQRGGRNREVFANELVTRGFYAHTRNPMYVANFSVVVGFSFIYGSAWGYGLLVPLFAYIYLAITTVEETYLREKFAAAYDDYARRVNRFFPDLRGLRKSLAEFSYDWRRALVKDYGTLCFTLVGLLGLVAWKIAWVYGYAAHKSALLLLCGGCVAVAIFYGIIRYLKITKRLRAARREETEQPIEAG